jgi:hypothetical protein
MSGLVERVASLIAYDCDPTDTARKARASEVVDMVLAEAAKQVTNFAQQDVNKHVAAYRIRALGGGK